MERNIRLAILVAMVGSSAGCSEVEGANATGFGTNTGPATSGPGQMTTTGISGTTGDTGVSGSGSSGALTDGGSESDSSGSSDGESDGGSSSSSTGTAIACGNTVVEVGEECDDGDADDGNLCANDCTWNAMLVFVTSTLQSANLGGLAGANQVCQDLADAAGLDGTFAAWLGTSAASPSTTFTQSTEPYILVDGTIVADDWADLTDAGNLDHAIDQTENGGAPPAGGVTCSSQVVLGAVGVFSNNFFHGGSFGGGQSCSDWTSTSGSARYGMIDAENPFWSMCGISNCGIQAPLYCFEQ